MIKRLHILILILTLGYFLLPTLSYACSTKTEKSCCNTETTYKIEKKDCCNDKNSKDKDNGCEGKCGHPNCTSSTSINFSLISTFDIDFNFFNLNFSSEKQKFYNSKTFISSGFFSVWLIPKIS